MNRILLVSDNSNGFEQIERELSWNGIQSIKYNSLKDAFNKAKSSAPDLIVVNTLDTEQEIGVFSTKIKMKYHRRKLITGFIGLEDYLKMQTPEHIVIRGLLRNKEQISNEVVFFISQNALPTFQN